MEKIDFKGREIQPGDLLGLVANKVQEIVEWINEHDQAKGGSMTQNEK